MCELLLDKSKADIEGADDSGDTPLVRAADMGDAEVCKILLSRGAKVDVKFSENNRSLFLGTVFHGHLEVCELLLDTGKVDIEEADDQDGATALKIAANGGHEDLVELLLTRGAKADVKDKDGFTPLLDACEKGFAEICKQLIVAGSDVGDRIHPTLWTPLHYAAINGYERVIQVLLSYKADVNAREWMGATPLHCASQEGHCAAVETLLEGGADPLQPDKKGALPIHAAAQNNHNDSVKILMELGKCSPDQVSKLC